MIAHNIKFSISWSVCGMCTKSVWIRFYTLFFRSRCCCCCLLLLYVTFNKFNLLWICLLFFSSLHSALLFQMIPFPTKFSIERVLYHFVRLLIQRKIGSFEMKCNECHTLLPYNVSLSLSFLLTHRTSIEQTNVVFSVQRTYSGKEKNNRTRYEKRLKYQKALLLERTKTTTAIPPYTTKEQCVLSFFIFRIFVRFVRVFQCTMNRILIMAFPI